MPPEIMRPVPLGDALDVIQMQKAATPAPRPNGLQEAAEILDGTKANAVVLEKSSFDEGFINARRIEAARAFVQRLEASPRRQRVAWKLRPGLQGGCPLKTSSRRQRVAWKLRPGLQGGWPLKQAPGVSAWRGNSGLACWVGGP